MEVSKQELKLSWNGHFKIFWLFWSFPLSFQAVQDVIYAEVCRNS